jgi:hypothetical protein
MNPCICQQCKNLRITEVEAEINETNEVEIQECDYDFPSEACVTCEDLECDLTCEHFESMSHQDEFIIAYCATCNKELKLATQNDEEGDVYCVSCYLKQ